MYVPPSFAETDPAALTAFMARHSFGTLVTVVDGEPFATHVPLLFEPGPGPHGSLVGHIARANPQGRTADGQPALAIFRGPHAYISPAWYEADAVVPTWNYAAVHATGTLAWIEDRDALLDIVTRSVAVYEAGRATPWTFDVGPVEGLLRAIVGFRLTIHRLDGKWKMSQNQPPERREKVIAALERQGGVNAKAVATMVRATLPPEDAR